jgi:hypothetical protein
MTKKMSRLLQSDLQYEEDYKLRCDDDGKEVEVVFWDHHLSYLSYTLDQKDKKRLT